MRSFFFAEAHAVSARDASEVRHFLGLGGAFGLLGASGLRCFGVCQLVVCQLEC